MSDWAFIEHCTDHLERPRSGDSKHPTLWPSEASAVITNQYDEQVVVGKCRRAILFRYASHNYDFYPKYAHLATLVQELKEKAVPVDRYMRWIWRAGELYEDYLTDIAKESGVYEGTQIIVYIKEYNISGKIDIRIINPETHKFSNIEVKSVHGFGGNTVLGTPSDRRNGRLGTPRDGNLMQIAIYHWWHASSDEGYEDSRLVYGDRGTGRYAEYLVKTEEDEDGTIKILYKGQAPCNTEWVESPITINSILQEGYQYVQNHLDGGAIPPRDFDKRYSEERILQQYERGELSKAHAAQVDKRAARVTENEERVADGKAPKKQLNRVEKGDWQCRFCQYQNVCYDPDSGEPRDL